MSGILFTTDDHSAATRELYIVTDQDDKELMVMPLPAILRQGLTFRLVMLALMDREKRLVLQKSPASRPVFPGKWDIFSSPVKTGDSRQGTALKLLREEAGILQDIRLTERPGLPPSAPELPCAITLYTARPSPGAVILASQRNDIMLADEDELNGLIQGDPNMFAPPLLAIQRQGLLFSQKN